MANDCIQVTTEDERHYAASLTLDGDKWKLALSEDPGHPVWMLPWDRWVELAERVLEENIRRKVGAHDGEA